MTKKEPRLFVRVTDDEHEAAMTLAEELGLTVSELVRILFRLPRGYFDGKETRPVLVVDAVSARKLARETRWWGYQYNQIAHALNRIAMYLRRDMCDAADALEQLQVVEEKVDRANADIAVLRAEAQRMAAMFNVKK